MNRSAHAKIGFFSSGMMTGATAMSLTLSSAA